MTDTKSTAIPTVSITTARTMLPELVKSANAGMTTIITLSGLPVAQIGPLPDTNETLGVTPEKRPAEVRTPVQAQAGIDAILRGSRRGRE